MEHVVNKYFKKKNTHTHTHTHTQSFKIGQSTMGRQVFYKQKCFKCPRSISVAVLWKVSKAL